MRVCIVLDDDLRGPPRGGVAKATLLVCKGLLHEGHDVTVVGGGDRRAGDWQGVPAVWVPRPSGRMLVGGARRWSRAMAATLARLDPDVVQGQGLGFAGVAAVAWRGGPRAVSAHGNIEMDIRNAYAEIGRLLRAPLVRAYAREAVRRADTVVNVTTDWRVNCPVRPTAMVHIPNPVDEAFFTAEPSPEPGRVAFFGGTRRIKGADLLMAAWPDVVRRSPGATLHLYGLESGDPAILPPRTTAYDALDTSAEAAEAVSRAAVVVLPSRFEVSPLLAGEAMAAGVPLVATDVGGVRAMAGGVASLCRPEAADIAAHLLGALEGSSEQEERVREGRRRSMAYRTDAVASAYASLYATLVSDRRLTAGDRRPAVYDKAATPPEPDENGALPTERTGR